MHRSLAHKVTFAFGFSVVCLVEHTAVAEDEQVHAPEFEQYRVEVSSADTLSSMVDLSSHSYARMFRTRLREGAAGGINFGGHYAAVSWGCGNECQSTLIVDLRTGKVLGVEGTAKPLGSARGVEFRENSRLLLADPPCSKECYENCDCLSFGKGDVPIRYYVIEEGGLRQLGDQRCLESR